MYSYEDRFRAVELYYRYGKKPPRLSENLDIRPQNNWAAGFGFMKRPAIYPEI